MSILNMWVIYDHPTDFPNDIIARRWEIEASKATATDDTMVSDLKTLRGEMIARGLACLPRAEEDDKAIVEVWV